MMRRRGAWSVFIAGAALASTLVVAMERPASAAASVGDEAALRAAFADDNETLVDLTADITLTNCDTGNVQRNSGTDLTLDGHGHTITQTCSNRVLEIKGGGKFTAQNVTITGGDATGNTSPFGGGIGDFGPGSLEVIGSVITGNTAHGGGGVLGVGGITVTNSTITANTSDYDSALDSDDFITISGSSITGNTSTDAVVDNAGGTVGGLGQVTVRDSTIANNVDPVRNTLRTTGNITVINSTLSGNGPASAISGDAVALVYATVVDNGGGEGPANVSAATMTSFGSVVALPRSGRANCSAGSATSNGFNFSDDASCQFTNAAQKDRETAGDPALGPLGKNGGTTETRKPSDTSPLKDAIAKEQCQTDAAGDVTTDQIGTARPQGGGCDIGAFEVPLAAPTTTSAPAVTATVVAVASSSSASSSSSGAPIALIVIAILVIGGIVVALAMRRRRGDAT